ncbi:MAG: UDP-N-acetylmuramate--alanine ligase [Chlamydiales bacterium]|jgi:UDP-N-acetylmuramate--alanine ligase
MTQGPYHFIGIGGIGMSALARILIQRNIKVSGSDITRNKNVMALEQLGAQLKLGHDSSNIKKGMTVVYSSAVKQGNPELQAAKTQQCTLIHRSDLLKDLMSGYHSLNVTGTHGKTTTSSLLAAVMVHAGFDPSYAIGGMLADFESNGTSGAGKYFVAEADESDGSFTKYPSHGAIVTNLEKEHMDHYGSEKALESAFQGFITEVSSKELLFTCGDDPGLRKIYQGQAVWYGFGENCNLRTTSYHHKGWGTVFNLDFEGNKYSDIELSLSGKHNVLNATAVFGLALRLGIPENSIRKTFREFKGIGRRCQLLGEYRQVRILDDYAHHPTEISTTLEAIKSGSGERRVVGVFQPHRYSRTKDCMESFASVFDAADKLLITDIYAAGEDPIEGVSAEAILQEIQKASKLPCHYVPRDQLKDKLVDLLRPHDIVVTMGAGDITNVASELVNHFKISPPKQLTVAILKGGRSSEHEISLESAKNVSQSLNTDLYDLKEITISKDGYWKKSTTASEKLVSPGVLEDLYSCDIVIPVLHGPFGEDGIVQGFLDTLGIAYVGCDHRSAALCMDKVVCKRMVEAVGIPIVPYTTFSQTEWRHSPQEILERISKQLKFPLFVKPSHLGSSIGVSKVEEEKDLNTAIEQAFSGDTHVLVEEGVVGRELEFAVLGNDNVEVAGPGEVCTNGKVYSFESKYGSSSMSTNIQPELPDGVAEKGRALAKKAYTAALCTGLARVDFFYDEKGEYWLNEINPLPGFTSISLYPSIWKANGLDSSALMDKLLILGLERSRSQERSLNVTS